MLRRADDVQEGRQNSYPRLLPAQLIWRFLGTQELIGAKSLVTDFANALNFIEIEGKLHLAIIHCSSLMYKTPAMWLRSGKIETRPDYKLNFLT